MIKNAFALFSFIFVYSIEKSIGGAVPSFALNVDDQGNDDDPLPSSDTAQAGSSSDVTRKFFSC